MLVELVVTGLGIIEATELELDRGCSALTGETGAGKTLVVQALELLLGGRGDRLLVREGCREARVEGRFLLPPEHPARARLVERDLLDDPGAPEIEVVVARSLGRDGRSRARVNGRLVTLRALAEVGESLVEIAGQQEHGRITSPAVQRQVLDAFAGPECVELAAEVATSVADAARAERAARRLASEERASRRELEALAREIAEIEAAAPVEGESEALAAEVLRLEHAEAIQSGIGRALEALRAERGAGELLTQAAASVAKLADLDPFLKRASERLGTAAYEVEDVGLELAERAASVDAAELETLRSRLALLQRLHRKYGDGDGEVLAYLEGARARRSVVESSEEERGRAEAERDEARARAETLAVRLGDLRRAEARELAARIEEHLGALALGDAKVDVRLEPRPLYEGGAESVTLLFAANPGETLRPLAKVASGGELARVTLAVHLLAGPRASHLIVFDEIDAGVGGAAAQSIGRSIAGLAARTGGQVVVVTHLPQVAAFADAHFRVTKTSSGGRAAARVTRVDGDERVAELSRMLAGLPRSARARGHARELLDLAASR